MTMSKSSNKKAAKAPQANPPEISPARPEKPLAGEVLRRVLGQNGSQEKLIAKVAKTLLKEAQQTELERLVNYIRTQTLGREGADLGQELGPEHIPGLKALAGEEDAAPRNDGRIRDKETLRDIVETEACEEGILDPLVIAAALRDYGNPAMARERNQLLRAMDGYSMSFSRRVCLEVANDLVEEYEAKAKSRRS
jgi:hypothetical protein